MKVCYKGIVTAQFILLLSIQSAFGQISLVSSSPADGDVNMPTQTVFSLTFDAPIDTTARFGHSNDLFLAIEIIPEDSVDGPEEITASADLKTFTFSGVTLTPNTQFSVFLTGAKSVGGLSLLHPYVITFTTGDSLPSGQVSGEVTFPAGDPTGAAVGLMWLNMFDNEVTSIGVVTSPYSIHYVQDGTYLPMSVKDTDGDYEFNIESGDAVGFYDPDADGVADTIVVVNGDTVTNVDIVLSQPDSVTARDAVDETEPIALDWATDAQLFGVESGGLLEDGWAYLWVAIFHSDSLDEVKVFGKFGDFVVPLGADEFQLPDSVGLTGAWIDSDSAMTIANEAGGADFTQQYNDFEIYASLYTLEQNGMAPFSEGQTFLSSKKTKKIQTFFANRETEATINTFGPTWQLFFYSEEWDESFGVTIDALTGDLLHSSTPHSARDRLAAVADSARAWAADAHLIDLGTDDLDNDGLAEQWKFSFFSATEDSILTFWSSSETTFDTYIRPSYEASSLDSLPAGWIDSPDATAIAEANSNDFRQNHEQLWVSAELGRGFDGDPRAIWCFYYESHNNADRLKILLDAVTGALIGTEGPLLLTSSNPENGNTNVSTLATFEFTFSAPLDTNFLFFDEPLELEFFPEDSVGEPSHVDVSTDLMTVTYHDVPLTTNTQFIILLTGAMSLDNEFLEKPYVINFTTDSQLPTGSVHGDVNSGDEDDHYGTPVALLKKNVFYDKVVALGIANSPYSLDYVPDGSFLPIAFGIGPKGAGFGFYDPDNDGAPDTVTVTNSDSLHGIDIDFIEPAAQTAQERLPDIKAAIPAWAEDARLVGIASENINDEGEAPNWVYLFYSPSLDEFNGLFQIGSVIITVDSKDDFPDTTALPTTWIDSDSAATIVNENGGDEFRAMFQDIEVLAALKVGDEFSMGLSSLKIANRPIMANHAEMSSSKRSNPDLESVAVWFFGFYTYAKNAFLEVVIDAVSGEVLFTNSPHAAQERLPFANGIAAIWALDAKLINLGSPDVNSDGRSSEWRFSYYSAAKDSVLAISSFSLESVDIEVLEPQGHPSIEPLPEGWISSPSAAGIAESNSGDFRDHHNDTWVEAILSRGLQGDSRAIWMFKYTSHDFPDSAKITIDALTGDVLTDVQAVNSRIPESFALMQNFPNPFNPGTTIKYQLTTAGQVKLNVYNLLGQQVRKLISKQQPPGYYQTSWDGRDDAGRLVTSGLYLYRLESAKNVMTLKMLFIR